MAKKNELKVLNSLKDVFIWWGGNSYYPEYAIEYIDSLDENDRRNLREHMEEILRRRLSNCALLNTLTDDMGFERDHNATLFFQGVYSYLFEDGSEPDILDYLT